MSKPTSFKVEGGVLSSDQALYILDSYMYATRDFSGKCDNQFYVCSASRKALKKEFGLDYVELCIAKSYASAKYSLKKGGVSKTVKFTGDEVGILKSICQRKQKYNGRGQDPGCKS